MRNGEILKVQWVLLVVLIVVLSGLVMAVVRAADPAAPSGLQRLLDAPREEKADVLRMLGMHPRMADISLAVREQVDFLLTPALLVQEAISEDVVLTYPEE